MKNILLNQRKERDELLAQNYLSRRTVMSQEMMLQSRLIKLITGPRRVGKSTQALQMLRNRNFAYLNFDSQPLLGHWDADLVMRMLEEVYPDYEYLLLDEVQNLPEWDLWVSELYRRGKNMVITGSNAKMLSSEMATVLTGKYLQIEMLPFSISEFAEWRKRLLPVAEQDETTDTILRENYLHNGGYPETVGVPALAKNYLNTLFDSIVWKDVAKRHKIRNVEDINNLAMYMLTNFCNPMSANEVADAIGIRSVSTVQRFCGYLHEPYLFYYLSRYNNKLKLMNKAPRKVYVVDNGFVTAKAFSVTDNLGRLLENQVFIDLLRQGYNTEQSLFYYRSRNDKETDFVVRENNRVKCLIQVCYDISKEKTLKRECSALIEGAEELHCEQLFIVTPKDNFTLSAGEHTIQIVSADKFCITNN